MSNIILSQAELYYEMYSDVYSVYKEVIYSSPNSEIQIVVDEPSILEDSSISVIEWIKEIVQYLYPIVFVVIIPIIVAIFIPIHTIQGIFWMGMATLMLTNLWILGEAIVSFSVWKSCRRLHQQPIPIDLPTRIAVIIPAYLPNEIDVLPDSIDAVCSMVLPYRARLRIIVVHNGGKYSQRRRWAQGWSEVTLNNINLLWNENISFYEKIMTFFLLDWREIYFYLVPFTLSAAIAYVIKVDSSICYPLLAACIFQIFIPIINAFVSAWHVKEDISDLTLTDYVLYAFISPFYEQVKNIIVHIGHARHILKMNQWVVTQRA